MSGKSLLLQFFDLRNRIVYTNFTRSDKVSGCKGREASVEIVSSEMASEGMQVASALLVRNR